MEGITKQDINDVCKEMNIKLLPSQVETLKKTLNSQGSLVVIDSRGMGKSTLHKVINEVIRIKGHKIKNVILD